MNGFVDGWKRSFEATGRLPNAYLFVGPPGSDKGEAVSQIVETLLGRAGCPPRTGQAGCFGSKWGGESRFSTPIPPHRGNFSAKHGEVTDREFFQPDLIRMAPEKDSIKIEQVRDLIRRLSLKPFGSGRLVVMIEEAEALTEEAANALLKTLEEPPPGALFILSVESDETLPATIRSRCQRVFFFEKKEISRARFEEVFRGLQDDLIPFLEGKRASFSRASQMAESFVTRPDSIHPLLMLLQALWHDLAVWGHSGEEGSLLLPAAAEITRKLADQKSSEKIFEDCDLIAETERAVEGNVNKTLALERLFVKLMS